MAATVAVLAFGSLESDSVWAQDKEPVVLNEVTWVDEFKWATQAIFVPERLRDVASVYVYPARVYEQIGGIAAIRNSDVRVGIAYKSDETEEWRAFPLDSMYASDDDQKYIFFSRRLRDVPEYEMLWVSWPSIRDFLPTTATAITSRGR